MATRKKTDPPMSEEAMAVEATIIENDIQKLSAFDMWIDEAQGKVSALASKHEVREIADEAGYAEAKAARTEVRRLREDIDSARKAKLREFEDLLKRAKQRVKDVIAPLDELDAAYKAELVTYDEARAYERSLMLAERYQDMAPALADMLPYFRLAELSDPESRWLMRSVDEKTAVDLMEHAASKAVEGYEAIGAMGLPEEDATAIRAEYFRSLDLAAAMARAQELKAERERIAEFEAERKQAEAPSVNERLRDHGYEYPPEPEPEPEDKPTPAIHPPVHADEAASWAKGEDLNPQPKVESSRPDTIQTEVAHAAALPMDEEVPPIALIAYLTEAQHAGLVVYCKQRGIKGFFKATHGRRMKIEFA